MLNQLDAAIGTGPTCVYLSIVGDAAATGATVDPSASHRLGSVRLLADFASAVHSASIELTDQVADLLTRLCSSPGSTRRAHSDVDGRDLTLMQQLVRDVIRVEREAGLTGLALIETSPTSQRRGLLRSWPVDSCAGTVSSCGSATVHFEDSHLVLEYSDERANIVGLQSFSLGIEGALVEDADGCSHLLDRDATEALCDVADGVTAWRVRTVPAALVWAPLLEGVESALVEVCSTGRPARIVVTADLRPQLSTS